MRLNLEISRRLVCGDNCLSGGIKSLGKRGVNKFFRGRRVGVGKTHSFPLEERSRNYDSANRLSLFSANASKVSLRFAKIRIEPQRLFEMRPGIVGPAHFYENLTQTVMHRWLERLELQ